MLYPWDGLLIRTSNILNGGQKDILEAEEAVEIADGKYLQGRLERTIAAFAGQPDDSQNWECLVPGSVSKSQMNTDDRSQEGDSDRISLRLMHGG